MIYDFLFSAIGMLLTSFPTTHSFYFSFWGRMQDFVSLLIFCTAVIIAYRYNGGSKGKDFIFRFIALDWLIFVRMVMFFTIPIFIIFYGAYKNMPYDLWIKFRIIFAILIEIFVYWRICVNIKDIAEKVTFNQMTSR